MSKTIEYSLLEPASSVEDFLKSNFRCSSNKLKKYFDKSFLNRAFPPHSTLQLPLNFVNDGEINPEYEGPQIATLYEDEIFLVIDKPANIFVHPLLYDEKNNCLSFLRQNKPEVLNVNHSSYDRGLLYRLDFETSGVLVYVKKENDYHFLRENFKSIARKKIYFCLVEGNCSLSGHYTHYFSSKEVKGKRVVVSDSMGNGDRGDLVISGKGYDIKTDTTMLEIDLKTGLRHQIRAQLSHLGHPLRGDDFYGGKTAKRLYLHAHQYQIDHQNQTYKFQSNPSDFSGL
ncbi:MAG: pseudouridine synthase [Bacteriovorax sp.]|jgi:23S rRNA-/tRNA-specific pseudouridylate synthase